MVLTLGNSLTLFSGSAEEREFLDSLLKVREAGARYSPAYRRGHWDGYTRLFKKDCFGSGLLPYVGRMAANAGFSVKVNDKRNGRPVLSKDTSLHLPKHIKELHDYQEEAVESILENKHNSLWFPRGVIEIGTGGGKTLIIARLIKRVDCPTLILVPGVELLMQTSKDLSELLQEEVGVIGKGIERICRVTVSTVKTLSLYPEAFNNYLERIQCLVIDECQHVPAKTFTDVANRCLNAFVRCGLSATPYDEDDVLKKLQVKYILGDTTITVRSPELIDRKIISPVTLFYVKITTPETVIVKYKDGEEAFDTWDLPYKQRLVKGSKIIDTPGAYEELIVRNDHRNRLFAKWMASKTRPTLGIVNWKEHGERLQQLLGCPFVTGDEPAKVRLKLIKDMSEGKLLHALCTPIFDEGINAPAIKYMALPAGGKAAGRLRQRIGRGVRRTGADDDHLEVLDALDMTNKTLARHSAERIKIAVKSGFKIKEITGEDF